MLEALIERCVVGVEPNFVGERLQNEFYGCNCRRLGVEWRLTLRVLVSVAGRRGVMAGDCVVG